jgi:hypothetical protein
MVTDGLLREDRHEFVLWVRHGSAYVMASEAGASDRGAARERD